MADMILNTVDPDDLECSDCAKFVSDDPDIYYCLDQHQEFPWHCGAHVPLIQSESVALGTDSNGYKP